MKFPPIIFFYFLTLFCISVARAQNNNSPYSALGIGDIENNYLDRSSGMGSSGVALFSNRFLYNGNPASFAFLDNKFFHLDASVRFRDVQYSGNAIGSGDISSSSDIQFKKLSAAIKIKPRWGFSIGLLPYSNVNYSMSTNKSIIGTSLTQPAYDQGSGSLNKGYITNSFKLANNLAIGLEMAFVFGQIEYDETIYGGVADSNVVSKHNTSIANPLFTLGLQYKVDFSKNFSVAIGAKGNVRTKLRANNGVNITYGNYQVINNPLLSSNYVSLPVSGAFGLAATIHDKLTLTSEYRLQNWQDLNIKGLGYQLVNSNRLSGGIEFGKKLEFADPYTKQRIKFERFFYQAGFYSSNSYLQLYGHQITDYGFTLGFGLNSLRNPLGFSMGLEIGKRGTTVDGLLKENYTQLTFSFSYRDLWYTSKKRYN